ncbi:hypothetical protein HMPREF9413_3854 [Paenibacillus sp. HGF7]|nr:hypothetical protein HMPREF9413_3854 [Paenibacillus sp. HGF7]
MRSIRFQPHEMTLGLQNAYPKLFLYLDNFWNHFRRKSG